MSKNWQTFWNSYRNDEARSEADLFVQVGKTIDGQPISKTMFDKMVDTIGRQLDLQPDDYLLDLCCGNGLLSYELATQVDHITAVDFAERMIATARRFKTRANVAYKVGNATSQLPSLVENDLRPTKLLINDSLAYFEPPELDRILGNMTNYMDGQAFSFLFTGIPDHTRKWNFYDTPARRRRHAQNESDPDNTNEGMGRWWRASEIETICRARNLHAEITEQSPDISHYRFDVLISHGR